MEEPVAKLVLAAMCGGEALDSNHGAPPIATGSAATATTVVGGTYLTSVEVGGFRGIGETVKVEIAPRPGLTVIAGRNGSGESSLAEALNLVLTSSSYRWAAKANSIQWSEQWRNLRRR